MQNSNYNHHIIEKQIYDYWEKNNFFKPKKNKKKYFSVVIPPPNVTGSLHMGHALNNSLQDLLVRFYRMNGYETLWGRHNNRKIFFFVLFWLKKFIFYPIIVYFVFYINVVII